MPARSTSQYDSQDYTGSVTKTNSMASQAKQEVVDPRKWTKCMEKQDPKEGYSAKYPWYKRSSVVTRAWRAVSYDPET
jgi:hypothetical protein